MTDEEYNRILRKSGKNTSGSVRYCVHPDGEFCIARRESGICTALYHTMFDGKPCPFFRDKRLMTERELKDYKKLLKDLSYE